MRDLSMNRARFRGEPLSTGPGTGSRSPCCVAGRASDAGSPRVLRMNRLACSTLRLLALLPCCCSPPAPRAAQDRTSCRRSRPSGTRRPIAGGDLVVRYDIEPGYYLYRDRMGFAPTTPGRHTRRRRDAGRPAPRGRVLRAAGASIAADRVACEAHVRRRAASVRPATEARRAAPTPACAIRRRTGPRTRRGCRPRRRGRQPAPAGAANRAAGRRASTSAPARPGRRPKATCCPRTRPSC